LWGYSNASKSVPTWKGIRREYPGRDTKACPRGLVSSGGQVLSAAVKGHHNEAWGWPSLGRVQRGEWTLSDEGNTWAILTLITRNVKTEAEARGRKLAGHAVCPL